MRVYQFRHVGTAVLQQKARILKDERAAVNSGRLFLRKTPVGLSIAGNMGRR